MLCCCQISKREVTTMTSEYFRVDSLLDFAHNRLLTAFTNENRLQHNNLASLKLTLF